MAYKKFKIHGKSPRGPAKRKQAPTQATPATQVVVQPEQAAPSPADQEIINKVDEFHTFMTQRGIPYLAVAKTPESGRPAGKFSFNHQHNTDGVTLRNAEWIFAHVGNMIDRGTNGFVRLIKYY